MTTSVAAPGGLRLPVLKQEDLKVWDPERQVCGGYLGKKASSVSFINRGKQQRRWFTLRTNILEDENYTLEYYHHPDDKLPRNIYPLGNASLLMSGGNSFTITLFDGTVITLTADTPAIQDNWSRMLERAIIVATDRDRIMRENFSAASGMEGSVDGSQKSDRQFAADDSSKQNRKSDKKESDNDKKDVSLDTLHMHRRPPTKDISAAARHLNAAASLASGSQTVSATSKPQTPFMYQHKEPPALRIDVDIHTIPPSTPARRQFEEMFEQDLARALKVDPEIVQIEVINVKPAAGMDWLALVEFDIYEIPQHQPDENGELDDELEEEMELQRVEHRQQLLFTLAGMLADRNSPLYSGFVTCKLDPTFERNLRGDFGDAADIPMVSTDDEIAEIMDRYKDASLPPDNIDNSHFTIFIHWEGTTVPLRVPNPFLLHRGKCVIWTFEIKKALGLLGTLQELWMEPKKLIPKNMPKALSQPVAFEPSARLGNGMKTINASKLKADLTYDVEMEDSREDQLSKLTQDQVDLMYATFNRYDLNGDGGISKKEMEELVRMRIHERKEIIEEKYAAFVSQEDVSAAELEQAEINRKEYLQHMNEAQAKLLTMFEAADVNHDGVLSLHEFLLAESWWLQCALNPEGTHLF